MSSDTKQGGLPLGPLGSHLDGTVPPAFLRIMACLVRTVACVHSIEKNLQGVAFHPLCSLRPSPVPQVFRVFDSKVNTDFFIDKVSSELMPPFAGAPLWKTGQHGYQSLSKERHAHELRMRKLYQNHACYSPHVTGRLRQCEEF